MARPVRAPTRSVTIGRVWAITPERFSVVHPAVLPLPHNPSRCRFYEPADWNGHATLRERRARWLEVVESRWEECDYHVDDWAKIAQAACWVLEIELQDEPEVWSTDRWSLLGGYPEAALDEREIHAVDMLFGDPITWTPGQDEVEDGQHRACALRCVKAAAVPVLDLSRA